MIQPNKKIKQESYSNLTDYSLECPKGLRSFFVFVDFEDKSSCLWSNIFAVDRREANQMVLEKFADCLGYMKGYSLLEAY